MPPAAPRPERVAPVALSLLLDELHAQGAHPVGPDHGTAVTTRVTGITHDSRSVRSGDLYAALPGEHVHGAAYISEAVGRGAAAVLTDMSEMAKRAIPDGLPSLRVTDPRGVLGSVAARVYGDPSRHLALYGVTGTNGKTTTAYLLESGLRAAGRTTGLLGTIETRIGTRTWPSARTTPESTDLQALLAYMVEQGVTDVAMEVSSHALALGRVHGCWFTAAGFTNLGRDHLDFHGDPESYFEAKASLFTPQYTRLAVVDVTDAAGARLAARIRGVRVVEVGADIAVATRMLGAHNERNAALALTMLVESGTDPVAAATGVAALPGVPGRLERIDEGQPFLAMVDYAHTPDAVRVLLESLRPLTERRLVIVLGCGGDRDRGKRPVMGELAATLADEAIFTDDNPRSERSADILAAMLAGVPDERRDVVTVEPDREAAIRLAVAQAGPGDVVVIAGKGHESGQDVLGVVRPFDDRDVLRDVLRETAA